jgi:hypothetical protein
MEKALQQSIIEHKVNELSDVNIKKAFSTHTFRFYIEAIRWVLGQIHELVEREAADYGEIAIFAPFISDSLRFSFSNEFEKSGIPFLTYHPYRSLGDEPIIQAILTFIKLAAPDWQIKPTRQDVRHAFTLVLKDCDSVRADLISHILYKPNQSSNWLNSFANINLDMQERITFLLGKGYEHIRIWLSENPLSDEDLDHWISRFFGEVLSQPGFGLHEDFANSSVIARLIESFKKFREVILPDEIEPENAICLEYIKVLESGILAAQSISASKKEIDQDAVILAPAYTYLVNNRPVKYQFWMDIGSQGWWSRLDQPLTQPYVLNRNWDLGQRWTDIHEYATNQEMLNRLTTGLLRRCRDHVYLCSININEQGLEEKGALLLGVQNILRALSKPSGGTNV